RSACRTGRPGSRTAVVNSHPAGQTKTMDRLDALLRLVERMRAPHTFEALMQMIADGTAEIVGARRASVRLLDSGRSQLIAVARAGQPLHDQPVELRRGEGLIGWIVEHGQILRLDDA